MTPVVYDDLLDAGLPPGPLSRVPVSQNATGKVHTSRDCRHLREGARKLHIDMTTTPAGTLCAVCPPLPPGGDAVRYVGAASGFLYHLSTEPGRQFNLTDEWSVLTLRLRAAVFNRPDQLADVNSDTDRATLATWMQDVTDTAGEKLAAVLAQLAATGDTPREVVRRRAVLGALGGRNVMTGAVADPAHTMVSDSGATGADTDKSSWIRWSEVVAATGDTAAASEVAMFHGYIWIATHQPATLAPQGPPRTPAQDCPWAWLLAEWRLVAGEHLQHKVAGWARTYHQDMATDRAAALVVVLTPGPCTQRHQRADVALHAVHRQRSVSIAGSAATLSVMSPACAAWLTDRGAPSRRYRSVFAELPLPDRYRNDDDADALLALAADIITSGETSIPGVVSAALGVHHAVS